MSTAEITTPDDMLEAAVLMREQVLDAEAEKDKANPEGPRYQTTLLINGEVVPIVDQPEEVKFATATAAVNARAEQYEEETYRVAKFKLSKMSEVEAVDLLAEMSPGDKEIYLRAEKDGKNRKAIFEVFGSPVEKE